MKRVLFMAAMAAAIVGCSEKRVPTEAELFGYKGHDLEDQDDQMYFATGPSVTNWVPARVLTVFEHYEFTSNELALVAAAGVLTPADSLKEIPSGYAEKEKEPWFTTWTREIEAFGKQGVTGFISHFNADKKVWETGENYFSTYYDSRDAARKALVELESAIARFAPKKFYRFQDSFVAEYVRLRVMGLCGQRPDGKWTCMLSLNDKCRPGCGQWEPVEAQNERIAENAFRAEMKAWREQTDKIARDNHAAVMAKAKAAELKLFGEGIEPQPTGDGRLVYVRGDQFAASNLVEQTFWDEKAKELFDATAAKLDAPKKQEYGPYNVWYAEGSNKLFSVRLDVAFPKATTNSAERAEFGGEWRELCFELMQPGFEMPPRPSRKK